MTEDNGQTYILRQARETGVELIRLWFCDVQGRLKEVAITEEQLEVALNEGVGVDGGVMGGPSQDESELILHPDPTTWTLLPTPGDEKRVARVFCDVRDPSGEPAPDDTRAVLKQALSDAAERGFAFYVGAEIEHYCFRSTPDGGLEPLDQRGRFAPQDHDDVLRLERETLSTLEKLGIGVDFLHHEDAPGQLKVGLQYSDALTMADGLLTYRQTVGQVARRYDVLTSFMPKPLTDEEGSGLHLSLSLAEGERNAFYDEDDALGLSSLARSFVAGVLLHAPALSLISNPTVNSYKRLGVGFSAPVAARGARAGRGALLRVPRLQAGHGATSSRVELRLADPSCNPYLTLATLLRAGLDGVDRGLVPPPPRRPEAPIAEAGVALPSSLAEAVQAASSSELLESALGAPLLGRLLASARAEWAEFHRQISPWELERYL